MVSLKSSDAELIAFAREEMKARPQGNPFPRRIDTPFRTYFPLRESVPAMEWSSEKILLEQVSKAYFAEGHLLDATQAIRQLALSTDLQSVLEQSADRSASNLAQLKKVLTPEASVLFGQGEWPLRAGRLLLPDMKPSQARDEWIVTFNYEAASAQVGAYRLALLWATQLGQGRLSIPLQLGAERTTESINQLIGWIRTHVHHG